MPSDVQGSTRKWVAPLIGAAGVYLYLALLVDPSLMYGQVPWFEQFSPERGFFVGRMGVPGGPAQYIASLIADFYLWRWFSALVLTALGLLLAWQAGWILERLAGAAARQWRVVVLFLYLLLLGRYSQQIASPVGLAIALGGAQLYLRSGPAAAWARTAIFCILAAAVSWAASGLVFVFILLAIISEASRGSHRLQILLYIMAAEGIPYLVGVVGLQAQVSDSFLKLLPYVQQTDAAGGYALAALTVCLPVLAIVALVVARRSRGAQEAEPAPQLAPARTAHIVAGAAFTAGLLLIGFDFGTHYTLLARQYLRQGRWDQVIAQARKVPPAHFTFGMANDVNRALAETGRLPYEMFSFAQNEDSLALYNGGTHDPFRMLQSARRSILLEHGELALRMGLLNDAEHQYHEALEMFGSPPEALLGLARVNIAKGNLNAAFIFTRALARDPGYHFIARDLIKGFPNAVLSPEAVHRIRSLTLPGQRGYLPPFLDLSCLELLKYHPDNRLAFEYLMAYYLLKRDLRPFVAQLGRLDALGYSEIPTHWQEAILMHAAFTTTPPQTAGHWLSPDIIQRSIDFLTTVTPLVHSGKAEEAKAATKDAYGNTYFYYFTFGTSGAGRR
jgi:hypothetical protein